MAEKRKQSEIWLHFNKDGDNRALCKYCKFSLSVAGGSHGNLSRHIKAKHPHMPLNFSRQPSTVVAKSVTEVTTSEQPSTSQLLQTQSQTSLTHFFRKPPPARKVNQIDRQVLKMIVKGHHALRIVDEPEFSKLTVDISNCPGYTLPTRNSLSKIILPSTYCEILSSVKISLQSAIAVCLTTDGWTSQTNSSYVAVTAHFIDENTELKSYLLACDEFGERHTAENLGTFLKKVTADFEIENKITAIVSDNAANVTAAICQCQWRGIGCFAHTLNLVVKSSLDQIRDTVVKVKRIVEYFHKSTQGLKKLKEMQTQMNLPDLKLKQDVATRWNSTYEMLDRIYVLKDAVISTLSLVRPDLSIPLEEWNLINDVIPILKPFYQITTEISAEKSVTLSKVTVLCNILESNILKRSSSRSEVMDIVKILQREIQHRFGDLERNSLYAESAILDPRFKRKGFKNDTSYQSAVKAIRNRIALVRLPNTIDDEHETIVEHQVGATDKDDIWGDYDYDFARTVRPENNTAAAIREFDKYLNEEYLDRKKDPLIWWKDRKQIYPRVYTYALKRLCIIATSVPCERIFSATGQIINQRRTLLKPNKVSKQVFLHYNM